MAISPQNKDFYIFYTSKLYGLTGMNSRRLESVLVICAELDSWPPTQPWPDTRTAPWMSCIVPPWPACEGRSSSNWTLPTIVGFHGSCWLLSRQSAFLRVCHEQRSFVGTLPIWKVNVILLFFLSPHFAILIEFWCDLTWLVLVGYPDIKWLQWLYSIDYNMPVGVISGNHPCHAPILTIVTSVIILAIICMSSAGSLYWLNNRSLGASRLRFWFQRLK